MDGPASRLAKTQTARRGRQDAPETPRVSVSLPRAPRTPAKLRLLSPLPTVHFLPGRERQRGEWELELQTDGLEGGQRGGGPGRGPGSGPAASGCLPHPTHSSRPQAPGRAAPFACGRPSATASCSPGAWPGLPACLSVLKPSTHAPP